MSEPTVRPAAVAEEDAARPSSAAEERVSVATQWQLMWWRFKKHRLAMISTAVVLLFYLVVVFADFLAYSDPLASEAQRSLLPPQRIQWFDEGRFSPHVYGLTGVRDPMTFKRVYTPDPSQKIAIRFFVSGFQYYVFGLIPMRLHLIGVADGTPEEKLFILGTDEQGRDLWSRLMYGTRTSMSIGLVGVGLSLILGVFLGGVSGLYGGILDTVIQRVIEILQSLPTIPIWLLMTAALPQDWRPDQVFFAITLILAFIGWTTLGREVRGRFLSLREEDFVLAAELVGASRLRVIVRHMVPAFTSHIIAASTLAIPVMIISETSLSFLGLGIRPPAISWGVLLQEAQNIQTVALAPWLLLPGVMVILAVLVFNLIGDGLRDAADPYGH